MKKKKNGVHYQTIQNQCGVIFILQSHPAFPMTPAIALLKKNKIPHTVHSYSHDAGHDSYGLEAAEKLGQSSKQVYKTLVVVLDGKELAVALVPVDRQLNLKRIAKAGGVKKAAMAEKAQVERTSGYIVGGVSPLAQKKRLPTFIDSSAQQFSTIFVSAGRRGLEIELAPADLLTLTRGSLAPLSG